LLDLPAEILYYIYTLYFAGRTFRFKDAFVCTQARLDHQGERHILALFHTCRQIYMEASLLQYSLNTFSFREFVLSFDPFLAHRTLAQFQAITSLELFTFQLERMWASPDAPSRLFRQSDRNNFLMRQPNLRKLRVIVEVMQSLYVEYGTCNRSFRKIQHLQDKLENALELSRPDVFIFFW
jgi:hypothetical protein